MANNRNLREDRIDVFFADDKFIETLKKWKMFCKSLDGGQTERIKKLVEEDLKKIKSEVLSKFDKI